MPVRIEKVTGDKVKVTLSADDLVSLDIDINSLVPDSKELNTFLFRILDTIREETGFNPFGGQVVVEATPSKDGISIIVRKLRPLMRGSEEIKNAVRVKAKPKKAAVAAIFYFGDFDDLCSALMMLTEEEITESALYKLGDVFAFVTDNSPSAVRRVSVLSEFSSGRSRYPMQLTYITEHGSLVAKGAALWEMAENIRSLT